MSKFLQAATLLLVITGLVGCGVGEPPPFDPRSLGETDRLASKDVSTYPMHPLPTTLQSPYLDENGQPRAIPPTTGPSLGSEPQVRLTLQEVIHRAVANSNDIKVAAYEPAIDQTRVIEAEARFDPTFFANAQVQRIEKEFAFNVAGAAAGAGTENTNTFQQHETDYTSAVGVRQQLESGGTIEFRNQSTITQNELLSNNTSVANGTENTNFGHNPAIENDFVLEVQQPLLQNFGNEINRARIVINRYNQQISLLEFRKQIEATIADIEKTYWDLTNAEANVKIQEELVSETIDTAERLVRRRGTDVSRVQISQANAELDSRRADLILAKGRVKDLSDQLKHDMNDPEFPIAGPIIVLPASPPVLEPIHFDPEDVTNTALANRFELGEQQLKVQSADTALKVGRNNLLPTLNAAGSVSLEGLSGGLEGIVNDQLQRRDLSWSFGLDFEVPIGNRAARAIYERALLQRSQAVDSYSAAVATVTLDCSQALNDVSYTWDGLSANREAVFAAEDALRGVNDREAAGEPLTPEFVELKLDRQGALADARRAESQSIADYNQSIARVEQAKGTLLQYENVMMQEDAIPYERKWLGK